MRFEELHLVPFGPENPGEKSFLRSSFDESKTEVIDLTGGL